MLVRGPVWVEMKKGGMVMQIETLILVGGLFAVSTFLILQGSFVRVLFGFILLSNAANLAVLSVSGGPTGREPPIVLDPYMSMADPLPQALILTAIVIGFGVAAYLIMLLYRIFLDYRSTNVHHIYDEEVGDRYTGEPSTGAGEPGKEGKEP